MNLDTLHEKALAFDISSDESALAIEELTRLGDFSLLPQLQVKANALVWDGPIADGIEHIGYAFQRYREVVQRMAEAQQSAR